MYRARMRLRAVAGPALAQRWRQAAGCALHTARACSSGAPASAAPVAAAHSAAAATPVTPAPATPASPAAAPETVAAVSTGFGPRRVVPSRVPVSKRALRATAAQQATAAAAGINGGAQTAAAGGNSEPGLEAATAFVAAPASGSVPPASAAAAAASSPDASNPSAPLKPKLNPLELARAHPGSRNLSSNQPPDVLDDNPYVHRRWYLGHQQAAKEGEQEEGEPGAAKMLPMCYITTAAELAQFQLYLARTETVALDSEFVSNNLYRPSLQLLQIATPDLLAAIDVPLIRESGGFTGMQALRELVATLVKKEWIVHAHRGDLSIMYDLAAEMGFAADKRLPAKLFDTQVALAFLTPQASTSLASMLELLLGQYVAKSESGSDWSARPLTVEQIAYGLEDVQFLFAAKRVLERALQESSAKQSALEHVLEQERAARAAGEHAEAAQTSEGGSQSATCFSFGRSDVGVRACWFGEEMSLLLNPLLYEHTDPELAYRGAFRSLRKLSPSSRPLVLFQCLMAWRERAAREANEPPARLVHDEILMRVAQAEPPITTVERLAPILGAAKRTLFARQGKAIVECIQEACDQLDKAQNNGATTTANPLGAPMADADASATSDVDAMDASDSVSHTISVSASTAAAAPSSYPFPSLPASHHSSGRVKHDLLHLLQGVGESRARAIRVAASVLAPRRDIIDMASLSFDAIRTAGQWADWDVDALGGAHLTADGDVPSGFTPSPLPTALNFRFANLEEEVVAERVLEGRNDAAGAFASQSTSSSPSSTSTVSSALSAEESPEDSLETPEEIAASAALAAAALESDSDTPGATTAPNQSVVASTHTPAPARAATEEDGLDRKEELTLLSRSKVLRGWRRSLLGDDLLRVVQGTPLRWHHHASALELDVHGDAFGRAEGSQRNVQWDATQGREVTGWEADPGAYEEDEEETHATYHRVKAHHYAKPKHTHTKSAQTKGHAR